MRCGKWLRSILGVAGGLVLLGGGLVAGPMAHATAEWCYDDPIVSINVNGVSVVLSSQVGAYGDPSSVTPHVAIGWFNYVLPSNATASVISTSNTYMHEKVSFSFTGPAVAPGHAVPVTLSIGFNASQSFSTQLVNSENGVTLSTATGSTDTGMNTSFVLQ
jgi:hypothetical protein